jgi:hypothetical protein
MGTKDIISLSVVGLYVFVTLVLLFWNIASAGGDVSLFFEQMSKGNFLLGPLGFILGHYFKQPETK